MSSSSRNSAELLGGMERPSPRSKRPHMLAPREMRSPFEFSQGSNLQSLFKPSSQSSGAPGLMSAWSSSQSPHLVAPVGRTLQVASQTAYLSPSLLAHSTGAANALEETRRAARAARHKLNFFIGKLLGQRPGDGNTSVPSGCRAWETYPLLYLRHPEGLTHGFGVVLLKNSSTTSANKPMIYLN